MKILLISLLFISLNAFSAINITLKKSITDTSSMPFITHTGPIDSFANALALNVEYKQVKALRKVIERKIKRPLKFLTAWDPAGEAHVTTITPPEFRDVLSKKLTMEEINNIARDEDIQRGKLKVIGIGSAKRKINAKNEETFFLLVESFRLRKIRYRIYDRFVQKGGDPMAFDPAWFFPHITIGYTSRDLHESDKVYKNIKFSYDKRFKIKVR